MNKIRCFLIDDEPPATELLKKYIGMIDDLEVVGVSYHAVKAFESLKALNPDLLFLDIQMPVLNGIDFIKTLRNPPGIILTTAHREYALEGYDLDVIDYLLKPIAFDRFLKAVERFRERSKQIAVKEKVEEQLPEHLYFNVNRTHHKVVLNEILYVESLKDYVRIHTQTERLVVKGNLGTIMKKLPEQQFVRIHRSFAIALPYLKSFNQTEVQIGAQQLPIGASYRNDLLARLSRD